MKTFTDREMKLISKLTTLPAQTTLQIRDACTLHSYCNPLPLFRVYKVDDHTFEAQWNDYHRAGPKQLFRFELRPVEISKLDEPSSQIPKP